MVENGIDVILELDLSELKWHYLSNGKVVIQLNSWGNSIPVVSRKVGDAKVLSEKHLSTGDRGGIIIY